MNLLGLSLFRNQEVVLRKALDDVPTEVRDLHVASHKVCGNAYDIFFTGRIIGLS